MAGTICEKSTRALLRDMLQAWYLKPGQVFTAQRALKWFAENYPKLRSTNITPHLMHCCRAQESLWNQDMRIE